MLITCLDLKSKEQRKITFIQSGPDIWKDLKQKKEACFTILFQEKHSNPTYQLTSDSVSFFDYKTTGQVLTSRKNRRNISLVHSSKGSILQIHFVSERVIPFSFLSFCYVLSVNLFCWQRWIKYKYAAMVFDNCNKQFPLSIIEKMKEI